MIIGEKVVIRTVTNKDLMKRLDALENRTAWMSAIFLLYSLATAFLIGYFSTENIMSLVVGGICYVFGSILALKIANIL